ncbi:MAG: hypothetical protein ACR2RV_23730 [Verrucomicrobiales bacterium]
MSSGETARVAVMVTDNHDVSHVHRFLDGIPTAAKSIELFSGHCFDFPRV